VPDLLAVAVPVASVGEVADVAQPLLAERSASQPTELQAEHSAGIGLNGATDSVHADGGKKADVVAEHSVKETNHAETKQTLSESPEVGNDRGGNRGSGVGINHLADSARADSIAEHSAAPLKLVPAEHSVKAAEKRATGRLSRQKALSQPVEKQSNVVQLNTQRGTVFEKSIWKQSRKKPGYLIRRLPGYNLAETEYGVSYLWVLSRKPDRTTADNSVHPAAGYFNWKALDDSGLLVKERRNDRRDKTAVG
jgi:hypothetical protein